MDLELAAWVALLRLPRASQRLRRQLLEQRGSARAALDAIQHETLPGLDRATRTQSRSPDSRVASDVAWLAADPSHHLVHLHDPAYPPLLKALPDAPLALWLDGERHALWLPQLAMVGSRNASRGGCELAADFARQLAQSGLAITSGLALGIDAAAHAGAMACGGKTLAVLGSGLQQIYPAKHRALADSIRRQGALISEFPLDTPPRPEHFPQRNRIISGMSLGVLVVEASLGSGSLITARLASEQGREVFAVPGSVHHPMARGCHALIRQGAKLVESAQDVLDELGPLARTLHCALSSTKDELLLAEQGIADADDGPRVVSLHHAEQGAAGKEHPVLRALAWDPCDLDTLIERCSLPLAQVTASLLELELNGAIESLPGGRYVRRAGQKP